MIRSVFVFIFLMVVAADGKVSAAKYARLVAKGERIALKLCRQDKLPKAGSSDSMDAISEAVRASGACPPLDRKKMEALVFFLKAGGSVASVGSNGHSIDVPKGAKCPVCGMFVGKYPKWAAEMRVEGRRYYFDGVKDMMKFYIFDGDFPYDRQKIESIFVTDFYTLEAIPAKKAWYVIGSEVYGPMGNELIPFKDKASAENFMKDHKGERILRFDEITGKIVMGLNGIDYSE